MLGFFAKLGRVGKRAVDAGLIWRVGPVAVASAHRGLLLPAALFFLMVFRGPEGDAVWTG